MSMLKDTIDRHRRSGRGPTATWVALGATALVAVMWSASPIAGRAQNPVRSGHGSEAREAHRLTDLASEMRDHSFWLARVGVTAAQTEQIAARLDQRSAEFEAFELARAALATRFSTVLVQPELDAIEMSRVRDEAKQLVTEVLDASFGLMTDVAQDLTPEQRADLIRHWEER